MQKNASDEIKQWENSSDPYDTHLKSSLGKLKLSFPFNGVPDVDKNKIIGFAAAGGYEKGKGWDGIGEFFNDNNLGVCLYNTYKIQTVILPRETIKFFVNKKPSTSDVSGNWNTGFLYSVKWYTNTRFAELQCANKMYDKSILQRVIDLANKIDKVIINK
jgi:hypothetical protein